MFATYGRSAAIALARQWVFTMQHYYEIYKVESGDIHADGAIFEFDDDCRRPRQLQCFQALGSSPIPAVISAITSLRILVPNRHGVMPHADET